MSEETRELAARILIACIGVTWMLVLWKGHKDDKMENFTFQSLIMTKDGYMDRVAFMEMGSWIWFGLILLWLTVHDKFSENYALIWVGFPAIRAGVSSGIKAFTLPTLPITEPKIVEPNKDKGG